MPAPIVPVMTGAASSGFSWGALGTSLLKYAGQILSVVGIAKSLLGDGNAEPDIEEMQKVALAQAAVQRVGAYLRQVAALNPELARQMINSPGFKEKLIREQLFWLTQAGDPSVSGVTNLNTTISKSGKQKDGGWKPKVRSSDVTPHEPIIIPDQLDSSGDSKRHSESLPNVQTPQIEFNQDKQDTRK